MITLCSFELVCPLLVHTVAGVVLALVLCLVWSLAWSIVLVAVWYNHGCSFFIKKHEKIGLCNTYITEKIVKLNRGKNTCHMKKTHICLRLIFTWHFLRESIIISICCELSLFIPPVRSWSSVLPRRGARWSRGRAPWGRCSFGISARHWSACTRWRR